MKIACLSLAPLYGEYVLGGSQKVLNDIVLGLRKNDIDLRVFSPIENNTSEDSFIGDVNPNISFSSIACTKSLQVKPIRFSLSGFNSIPPKIHNCGS